MRCDDQQLDKRYLCVRIADQWCAFGGTIGGALDFFYEIKIIADENKKHYAAKL
jgi:hypothetical protein